MKLFEEFIFKRTYARYIESENRREKWSETVDRYINYVFKDTPECFEKAFKEDCREAILNQEVMPSMRMLMTAGEAHARENISGYNCCFLSIEDPVAFSELMYVLLSGTGCGYSVERKFTQKLPIIPDAFDEADLELTIDDSKLGWAEAYKAHIDYLYEGKVLSFDYSKIRPKGTALKTFGGYASGPEVLEELINFTTNLFKNAAGRQLKPIECHSLCCKIASVIVVGGVRRSALISFSDLDDEEMAKAKSGEWWKDNQHFALANNSAVYDSKPSLQKFLEEYTTIYKSYSGERGFYNLDAVNKKVDRVGRRREVNENYNDFYSNPCCEIILRGNGEFCNLTEVIIRPTDTESTLMNKIQVASILGTLQSRYTNFKFLRPIYKQNCEEERLLGVSMTGIYDNPLTYNPDPEFLEKLRDYAVEVNRECAKLLNIKQSVSVTCIKPSGTVSALNSTSSGLHPAFSMYYIRNVRVSKTDPICQPLIRSGIKYETDFYSNDNYVFSFPLKSAETAVTVDDLKAVDHLKLWILYNKHFCEHKPSITISYKDDEYMDLGAMIYKHFDEITGIALLPKSNSTYQQMPFTKISEQEYLEAVAKMPKEIQWDETNEKFRVDNIDMLQCMGANCDIE